jgi:hypothetical protein
MSDVFPEIALDLASDDLLEPILVPLDFSYHGRKALDVGSTKPGTAAFEGAKTAPTRDRLREPDVARASTRSTSCPRQRRLTVARMAKIVVKRGREIEGRVWI